VVMTPSWAASRTLRRFVRAEVKLSKCRGIDMRGPSSEKRAAYAMVRRRMTYVKYLMYLE